jgi:N6-adenosine-specific RNA methylase IME4
MRTELIVTKDGAMIAFSNSLRDLAARINAEHTEVVHALKAGIEHGTKAGHLLIEAKAQIKHGGWLPWLKVYCLISARTATTYMLLAENVELLKSAGLADLTIEQALKLITDSKREARNAEKIERRAERVQDLAERMEYANSWRLDNKLYSVIYADPAWEWETWSDKGKLLTSPDNNYATTPLDVLKAMDVPAARDCLLAGWATVPRNPEAFECYSAWGFKYVSKIYWLKPSGGIGYWSQNRVEELLIFTRGNIPAPTFGSEGFPQWIEADRGEHSEKPEVFAEHITRLYPNVPKLEMFARRWTRPGWDFHGNEVPRDIAVHIGQRAVVGDNVAPVDLKPAAVKMLTDELSERHPFVPTRPQRAIKGSQQGGE